MEKKLRSVIKDRRGVLGLDLVKGVFLLFIILVVLGVAGILATTSLRDSNIFTSGTQEYNDTEDIVANYSGAVSDFFDESSTIISILVVVVIIAAIGIVIAIISRFGGGGRARANL
jgi:ABC-type glycerol-3-phosphate transport system permease component